jgi:hypothetical protein
MKIGKQRLKAGGEHAVSARGAAIKPAYPMRGNRNNRVAASPRSFLHKEL